MFFEAAKLLTALLLFQCFYIATQALILWAGLMINCCKICDENLVMIIHLLHVGIASAGSHTAKVPPLSVHVRVVGASGISSPLHEYSIVCIARNCPEISVGVVTECVSAVGGVSHTK